MARAWALRGGELGLGLGVAAAALAYDRAAPAAQTKALALLLVGLGAMGATVSRVAGPGGRRRWALSGAALGALGCTAWAMLSTLWASRPAGPVLAAAVGALGVMLGASTLGPERAQRVARSSAVLIGAGSAAACLAEAAAGARGMGLHGLQGNPDWLGLVLACALPLEIEAAAGAWRRRRRLGGGLATLAVALTAAALALARSRVAWFGLGVAALGLGGVLLDRRLGARGRRALRTLGGVLGLASIVGIGAALAVPAAWPRAAPAPRSEAELAPTRDGREAAGSEVRASWTGRRWIWQVGTRVALDALPFGVGLGDVHAEWLAEQGRELGPLPVREAAARFVNATTVHQDWIEATASGGAMGLLLLALTFGLGLWTLRVGWLGGATSALCVAACALGDSPLEQPAVMALLALVWAGAPRLRLGRPFMAAWAGVLAALIVLLPHAVASSLGWRLLARADTAAPAERLRWLRTAARTDPRSAEAALELGLDELALEAPERGLRHLERALALRASVGTEVAVGNAELELGRLEPAIAAYRQALELDPGSFRAHLNLAEALRQAEHFDQAEGELRAARSLQPGHPKLAQIAERLRRSRIEQESNP